MASISERFRSAWNAFLNKEDEYKYTPYSYGTYFSNYRPDRLRLSRGNERSIVTAIYNRIGIDCAAINLLHARVDENGRYLETINSGLNNCLTLEANIDQTGRAFILDAVISLLDEGVIAIVPVDTTLNPRITESYDIKTMRVGKITEWKPEHVRVELYNDRLGKKEEVTLPKTMVAIVENPLYSIMNEPNSTLQRLIRKLNLLDILDEKTSSGKIDLIIQLPYVVKSDARKQQAESRRKDIEMQLTGSQYGIAYTDGTEKITQLNRSIENQMLPQIEYLTKMLYSQLGITETVLDGTADNKTMLNYYNRTIEPILGAIALEMKRKFLTKTARTQGQSIYYFRDPFKLVPVEDIAEMADKFTRNEILSSNEIRAIVGYKPVDDERADELRNKNLNKSDAEMAAGPVSTRESDYGEEYDDPMNTRVSDL